MLPSGAGSVMAARREPPDSLDHFPTPPFATRALCEHVLFERPPFGTRLPMWCWRNCVVPPVGQAFARAPVIAWDPCAGDHHMVGPLAEYFATVQASDVHDYGYGDRVGSFVGGELDVIQPRGPIGWGIFNPPFNLALEFVERALAIAADGVACLVRSVWAEGGERYERLFWRRPPTLIAQFTERVNMCKGRWDPDGSTATSYAWFVWSKAAPAPAGGGSRYIWIPPGRRKALERPDDRARFAPWSLYPCPPAEIERMARELVDAGSPDFEGVNVPLRDTLTYLDARGRKPEMLSKIVTVHRWQSRIREADDIWARRLQVAQLTGAGA